MEPSIGTQPSFIAMQLGLESPKFLQGLLLVARVKLSSGSHIRCTLTQSHRLSSLITSPLRCRLAYSYQEDRQVTFSSGKHRRSLSASVEVGVDGFVNR